MTDPLKNEELKQNTERLNRERRQLLGQREQNEKLVRFAEEQCSLERRRTDHKEYAQQANIVRCGWWCLTGKPDVESTES